MSEIRECANGCQVPPSPPSKVLCEKCQVAITAKLTAMIARMERDNYEEDEDE